MQKLDINEKKNVALNIQEVLFRYLLYNMDQDFIDIVLFVLIFLFLPFFSFTRSDLNITKVGSINNAQYFSIRTGLLV